METFYISTVLISVLLGLLLLGRRAKKPQYYAVDPRSITDVKTRAFCDEINSERIPVPRKTQKMPVPKPQLHRRQFTYSYDEHDYFHYDVVFAENPTKEPLVLVCFMMGHSKSACIRRMTDAFVKQGHSVYVLLPRGALDTHISPMQKKFRSEGYDTEDLDTLIGLVPGSKVILAGYSLGGFTACHYMTNPGMKNAGKVQKLVLSFVEHDPNHTCRLPPRVKKFLGSGLSAYVNKNRKYFLAHGFSDEVLDDILKVGTVEYYDLRVWCNLKGMKTVEEYYDSISLHERMLKLRVPTLFLNTLDDIIGGDYIPFDQMRKNALIEAVVFNRGNHLGTVVADGSDLVSRVSCAWASQ